ncbi:dTMP kinase [Trichlorobacter ammonificans]|uniref:Thymidylate kinase n=1 Tax=Trichlorobacter ammonificans TaxID=2916410 RepID=A0ABM9D8L7_9BACT|nr:dTMP kinase [Trichlorobacter ammonificans]CAH2031514.1 Thymidylate kinase [Trichlorobacter ammonificans]
MFITFEGIEGSGKSTQIRLLADTLRAGGATVLLTREPGGCPVADRIRAVLLDAENRAMVAMTELMLYAAARAQHLAEVVRPALAAGAIVLCDRFSDATRAYQAFGRGLPRETVEQLNQLACDGLAPDLTLLLDCDTATGLERARSRIEAAGSGPREERFELEALSFHQRVREGYLRLAAEEPERFAVVPAEGAPAEIAVAVAAIVTGRLQRSAV